MDKLKKHKDKIIAVLITLSLLWVVLSVTMFFSDYKKLHYKGILPGPRTWHNMHIRSAPTAQDVERIQSWMTFTFINKVFNLPPEYLKEQLQISNTAYPNITVEAVAKSKNVSSEEILVPLREGLITRFALSTTTTIK